MITLTPSGDILIEGLGKVGEYGHTWEHTRTIFKINTDKGIKSGYAYAPDILKNDIQQLLTNGFTPKKWEE